MSNHSFEAIAAVVVIEFRSPSIIDRQGALLPWRCVVIHCFEDALFGKFTKLFLEYFIQRILWFLWRRPFLVASSEVKTILISFWSCFDLYLNGIDNEICSKNWSKSVFWNTLLAGAGEGTYATVFKGISRVNGKIVALQEIVLEPEEGAPCKERLILEQSVSVSDVFY